MSEEWRRRPSRSRRPGSIPSDPTPLAASLDAVTRDLGVPAASTLAAIFGRWADLVGEAVAAHSWPISVDRTTLTIGVDDPVWATQLSYLERSLVARLEEVVGAGQIEAVKLRIRPR